MEEKKNDGFEIPSFVENKEAIDKSIFRLNDEEDAVVKKEEYIPAHGENTAALRQRVARELNDVLETPRSSSEKEEPVMRRQPSQQDPQKTPLWIVILSVVAILAALLATTLFVKEILFSKQPSPSPTPTVTPTPSPSASSVPSASPSAGPNATSTPTSSPAPSSTPAVSPTPSANTSSERYVLDASMNVRSGPSTDNAIVDPTKIPSAYAGSAEGSVMKEGTVITVLEVRTNGSAKWGRIGDNAWICLEDGEHIYAKKK